MSLGHETHPFSSPFAVDANRSLRQHADFNGNDVAAPEVVRDKMMVLLACEQMALVLQLLLGKLVPNSDLTRVF